LLAMRELYCASAIAAAGVSGLQEQ
jgi:hypothetical protein